ncbi:MAG: MerR family transcriptional regulator [Betaproteobacteria bacterium]|jgi:DNA-binding transcriptional MerR regulator|nr:MerR family transcriptional regulator [Betaproteobacteria bacterium]
METALPPIPAKRYFTIGEVSDLCAVKPHVLRYWEQEFTQLRPMKRRGNRRYYQHHEVLMIRRIRGLLYEQGFTISGARNRLQEISHEFKLDDDENAVNHETPAANLIASAPHLEGWGLTPSSSESTGSKRLFLLRRELFEIRELLSEAHA